MTSLFTSLKHFVLNNQINLTCIYILGRHKLNRELRTVANKSELKDI